VPTLGLVEPGTSAPLVEGHRASRPGVPNHLLAGVMVVGQPADTAPTTEHLDCAAFASADAGDRWTRHDFGHAALPAGSPDWPCGDPWVALLGDGSAVFAMLGDRGEVLVYCPRTEAGRGPRHRFRWVARTTTRQWCWIRLVATSMSSPGRDGDSSTRRLRWTVCAARSRDGGRTFEHSAGVTPFVTNFEAQNPVVLSDGTLGIPFNDHHTIDDRNITGRSWLLLSTDGGRTFAEPLFIAEGCPGSGGWPSLAADASGGPYRDRMYHLCVDRDYRGVLLRRSSDRGETWSAPVRADAGRERAYTPIPSIAVDQSGVIGVSWYERRDDPERRCQFTHFSASRDRGATFLPDVRVSSPASCPAAGRNGGAAGRWPFGGDYAGLVALGDGSFRLLWSDSRDGVYRLRTATVRVRR
jgi:hypothetical protein